MLDLVLGVIIGFGLDGRRDDVFLEERLDVGDAPRKLLEFGIGRSL